MLLKLPPQGRHKDRYSFEHEPLLQHNQSYLEGHSDFHRLLLYSKSGKHWRELHLETQHDWDDWVTHQQVIPELKRLQHEEVYQRQDPLRYCGQHLAKVFHNQLQSNL